MTVDLNEYPVEEISQQYETHDMEDGTRFSDEDIDGFLRWGDDQDLHGGTAADMEAYDDEYGVSDTFPGLKTPADELYDRSVEELAANGDLDPAMVDDEGNVYRRIVPGAQLFATAVHNAAPIEQVDEVGFEEPVYEDEQVWLERDGDRYTFMKEDAVTGETVETGTMQVRHADEGYNDTLSTLVPIGMGQWDRTGDVLLGYADMEAEAPLDGLPDELDFEGAPGPGDDLEGVETHERRFIADETALSYQETDLHLG